MTLIEESFLSKDRYPIADVRNKGFKSRLMLNEAKNLLFKNVTLQTIKRVPLRNHKQSLLHTVLAEDIFAPNPIPNFPKSLRDGYAMRSSDTIGATRSNPVIMHVKGELEIQSHTQINLKIKEAIKIPTGGILPNSTDSVIMIEDVELIEQNSIQIKVFEEVKPQNWVSPIGEDIEKGAKVLNKGQRLRATDIGVLSTLGIHEISIFKRPSIGLFSSGHEVVDQPTPLNEGQVYDSNTYIVREYALDFGWDVTQYPVVPDIKMKLRNQLIKAVNENDFVLVSGGTAVGPRDLLPVIIAEEGTLLVHGIHISPASPTAAGVINKKIVFGLPGFPVSAIIAFLYLAVPVICKSTHTENYNFMMVPATINRSFKSPKGRRDFLRVKLILDENKWVAEPIRVSGSQLISSMLNADGIVEIDEDTELLEEGSYVQVQIITNWFKFN